MKRVRVFFRVTGYSRFGEGMARGWSNPTTIDACGRALAAAQAQGWTGLAVEEVRETPIPRAQWKTWLPKKGGR
jgi:hypothetical protein